MKSIQCAISIFIFEGDPVTSLSQKYFLESHDHSVEIVDVEASFESGRIKAEDIILLDVGIDVPINFPVLDQLLKIETRPKLLVTTIETQVFQQTDLFSGGPAHVLFKPFLPSELLGAIETLSLIENA